MAYKFSNIFKSYGDTCVLNNFSFEFPSEGIICLFGPSGCGKTTVANIFSGIEMPDRGEVFGTKEKRFSYVFQSDRLINWISAKENVLCVNNDEEKLNEIFETLMIKDDMLKFPSELSGGMRQRVAIARALSYDGDIYILDEPFKALDFELKQKVMNYIRKKVIGKLCIFITHDFNEASEFSDEILFLKGNPFEVLKRDKKGNDCKYLN